METQQTQNDPKEVAVFLISKLLQKGVNYETIIGGLRKAGVPEDIINSAWYTATSETEAEN